MEIAYLGIPVFILPKILNELTFIRESGFLGYQMISYFPPVIAEYWKSVELLEFHTKNRDENKYPAWNRFTQKINRDIQWKSGMKYSR